MHIGIDATCWQNNRGYGRHVRALLSALVRLDTENQYTFFLDSTENLETVPPEVDVRLVHTSVPTVRAASWRGNRSLRDMWQMSRAMSDGRFDLLIFPTIYSYIPVLSKAKKLVLIHDIIPERYPYLTLPGRRARLFWKLKSAIGRWQADAIVTVSDYSRQEIISEFNLTPERVFIVGEASDPIFHRMDDPQPTPCLQSFGINGREHVVLYVGGFGPHKNLEALVGVFAKLGMQDRFSDLRLVMVGEHDKDVFHSYFGTIKRKAEELGIADRVIFTGYLPDEELVVLLNLGTVLVLPSLMEGFGLPAMEAAACGCPVIATTASPLPRLLGEGGIYIDPLNRAQLESALVCVLESEDRRRRMQAAGLCSIRRFTWDAAARQMMSLIKKVAGR